MSTLLKTYDPAKVNLVIGGFRITGFDEGSFITLSRNMESWKYRQGPDGVEGVRSKSNNKSASLTIVLKHTAAANYVLSKLCRRDENTSEGVVPLSLTDVSAPETGFISSAAWVQKPADAEFGAEDTPRRWTIALASVDMIHGGTPTAQALSEVLA